MKKNMPDFEKELATFKEALTHQPLYTKIQSIEAINVVMEQTDFDVWHFIAVVKKLQIELMQTYQNMKYEEFNKKKQSEYIRNIRELSANSMTCLEMGLRVSSELIVIFAIISFLLFISCSSYFLFHKIYN